MQHFAVDCCVHVLFCISESWHNSLTILCSGYLLVLISAANTSIYCAGTPATYWYSTMTSMFTICFCSTLYRSASLLCGLLCRRHTDAVEQHGLMRCAFILSENTTARVHWKSNHCDVYRYAKFHLGSYTSLQLLLPIVCKAVADSN
jgi:hypothetical protein